MYSCGIYESKWHVRRLRRNFINVRYLAEVLCRMLPFSPQGNPDIVNQSHMVGACPPPRVNISTGKVYFPIIAFAGFCSSTFFGITIVPTRGLFIVSLYLGVCTTYPQGGWARYISSGRMSSRTTSCSSTTLVLVTIYPQGGWAHYISSGRMSSRTIRCSSTTMVLDTTYP